MDFAPTDEQLQIQQLVRRFAEQEVRPRAAELDEPGRFPRELFKKAGELGLFAMRYPGADGKRVDAVSWVLALEELAWGSLSLAASCLMQALMGTHFVHRFAASEVRERLLVPALRGDKVGTICMTEPGAGSDLGAVATRAEQRGATWHLTGSKTWITSAPVADFFTVLARTGPERLSLFLVERGAAGLEIGRPIEKAGVRASPTAEVFFDDTPATCLLGDEGAGMSYLREILAEIRVATGALAVGIARAAFEDACAYARQRRQFGRPIREFQAVGAHLADMAVDLEAARRLVHYAAYRVDAGTAGSEAAMAKLFASEAAQRICEHAARVCASWGFSSASSIERYLRDVRFTLIGGGTSEILRVNIAKEL